MSAPIDNNMGELNQLVLDLFEVEGVKFGNYTLKSGIQAPIYIDLRVLISYPKLMVKVSEFLWKKSQKVSNTFQTICGVPYTALPLATCITANHDIPMLIRRKEAKSYGTKKLIEGVFKEGDNCLIIEDICTSGSSVLETVEILNSVGIKVTDAVVLLDRNQGAVEVLQQRGITLHSVCGLKQVVEILEKEKKIDQDMVSKVLQFLEENRFHPTSSIKPETKNLKLSFNKRAELCSHPLSKQLFQIMNDKQTNLIVSADLTTCADVLQLADQVGPHVCMIKTHIDIIEDFTEEFTRKLTQLAQKHQFLIFEDRKFADIGNTVQLQYKNGIYNISEWAHVTNAHCLPGPGIISGLKQVGVVNGRGCLLVAEMSSNGNLATGEYTTASVKIAEENKDFVIGFICQKKLSDDPTLIHMTPGVKLGCGKDNLGQQYLTPEHVICKQGSDVVIVGRGITQASDVVQAAISYKQAAYEAYSTLIP